MDGLITADKKLVKDMGFARWQDDAGKRQFNLMSLELALKVGEGGTYWIAGCSTEDFLPTEQLEGLGGESTAGCRH
ncbi:MAG TPA: hypothetical protein VE422_25800 [Terriglobia bacterium]|nr:hypothetical protein [Terriglobia bacterium]